MMLSNKAVADHLRRLPGLLAQERGSEGLSLRETERQSGVPASLIRRVEGGENYTVRTALALLDWLAESE